MKPLLIKLTTFLIAFIFVAEAANAQFSRDLQYYTSPDKTGLNVFEPAIESDIEYDGFQLRIGGANTLQFQAFDQSGASDDLADLGSNFNLATSNLDIDVQLARGVRMHLRTYLSSRHHEDAWVKGGYLQVDRLDFIQEDFLGGLMDNVRMRVGHMTPNYGDNHFRRSDNAQAIHNPFVGNYIMDSFTTEVGGELYYMNNGILAMFGMTNSKLNQSVVEAADESIEDDPSFYGKLGYDTQLQNGFRFRLTGSFWNSSQTESVYLYSGDRAGARYYDVAGGGFRSGRINPDFSVSGFAPGGPVGGEVTSFMINPFVKFQGLEFYGVFESASGKNYNQDDTRTYNQYGAELLYRFGADEDFYLGGRYNLVDGKQSGGNDIDVDRLNIGGGWFMTDNILTKLEYVSQNYNGFEGGAEEDLEFSGVMLEAVISF